MLCGSTRTGERGVRLVFECWGLRCRRPAPLGTACIKVDVVTHKSDLIAPALQPLPRDSHNQTAFPNKVALFPSPGCGETRPTFLLPCQGPGCSDPCSETMGH